MRSTAGRAAVEAQPIDQESRLPLVRHSDFKLQPVDPILGNSTWRSIRQILEEYSNSQLLYKAGLAPTRTALFIGPPGVGKTLSAQWLAYKLNLPLLTLDLSSVMSSFLGRTGVNVRRVLDYAKNTPSVLLIDELDAVAKRRDDATELGELKRLVTVLLQEIDNWPEGSLLLAASNHEELLDPAIWRRFEMTITFPLPEDEEINRALVQFLDGTPIKTDLIELLTQLCKGMSFSRIEREVMQARRSSAINQIPLENALVERIKDGIFALPTSKRIETALHLMRSLKISQRRASELTGVSRDTLRKHQS
ncbi:AAA family ATPase [Saccharothrix deserti]|uniref:AAA family ATPase n=1 Tax=Saccharothrix deserti TaxID=2593674 RepID=UPI00192E4A6A|nr:ATP-binding protein [Saccharothrix deserti]